MMMSNKKINKIFKNILLISAISVPSMLGLTSCYPFLYHAPLEQGNIINPEKVQGLKIGMNKEQVLNIMGTPMLETALSPNSWRYVYVMRQKDKVVDQKKLSLYFSENKLTRISAD